MIHLIGCMAKNRVIGKDNKMPWHLPAELAYFKKVTTGHAVLMGRKTYESIGRPLPNRENIILTRDETYKAEGCTVINNINQVLGRTDEIFVIGGAELYNQFIDRADRLYVTLIDEEFEGDTFFPKIDEDIWHVASKTEGVRDEKNPYDFSFLIYERIVNR